MTVSVDYLDNIFLCLRLVLAAFLGGIIGIERGSHGQAAGLRTFSMVCLGSAAAMMTNEYLVGIYANTDSSRIAAGVVSGVGFLGAGTILVTGKSYVRGLTTAASLWTTSCLGIQLGCGDYIGGIATFIMIMFVILFMTKFSHFLDDTSSRIRLYMEADKSAGIKSLMSFAKERGFVIKSIEKTATKSLSHKDAGFLVHIDLGKKYTHADIINDLMDIDDVHYIEEIR